ncbi:MAG: Sulfite exporter TauE/SafE [Planctomycetes bacterium ADurb.Bin401]|nr:MAG: Sulfite exporter TauE/SafE [Planctomycetes bacterium ADurb.Bin401]
MLDFRNFLPQDFSNLQWLIMLLCAVLVGLNKTALPGVGIIVVPLIASFFPARLSTGLLLPMLALADLFAVGYYHRHANWKIILKLLPAAIVGIAAGSIVIRRIDDQSLRPVIGIIVLVMLALNCLREKYVKQDFSESKIFAGIMGFLAGLTTQLANAAGPVMTIYLLSMRLPKYEFIGTGAWYFLILNWLKMAIFASEGRITVQTISADIAMLPLIAAGAFAGIYILKKVPQKWFNWVVQILAAAAAVKLLF